MIDGLTRVEPYFEDAVRRGRRELIPVREYLHGPFAGMLQRANSVLNGAGACILRCSRAPQAAGCKRPCL